ncbi:CopG family antitoxin [[Phormidium] sp. ETS-05]|uniref:CopG family antitoxin n=1 Tax=[Phormidium] sp. ETS-05 TaxID=222819 RepID=UPI0018EF0A3B|nr:CopG family antitoxin [[Phormidium] sp. ETS-05]
MDGESCSQIKSIEDLANFWDNQDLPAFKLPVSKVKEKFFERHALVQIHLPKQDLEIVKKLAKSQGIDYTDLIRDWVLEKVRTA